MSTFIDLLRQHKDELERHYGPQLSLDSRRAIDAMLPVFFKVALNGFVLTAIMMIDCHYPAVIDIAPNANIAPPLIG